jgi:hypothetical protein
MVEALTGKQASDYADRLAATAADVLGREV